MTTDAVILGLLLLSGLGLAVAVAVGLINAWRKAERS